MRQCGPRACCFCGINDDDELQYGRFYQKGGIVVHYYCLLLSSKLAQRGRDNEGILGFLLEDISREVRRGRLIHCAYCGRHGATISCATSRCKRRFHLPCAKKNGSLHQFFNSFKSYCHVHRPRQRLAMRFAGGSAGTATCTICFEGVTPMPLNDVLWAPCCKRNAWFHRVCVQKLAVSAGYFFKCPNCNDKNKFKKTMLTMGVYVPEQDASWEMVPNAYEELLHRHDTCDVPSCRCPKGRSFSESGGLWEVVLCRLCGSQGVHVGCGSLKWSKPEWECPECIGIVGTGIGSRSIGMDGNSVTAADRPSASFHQQSTGNTNQAPEVGDVTMSLGNEHEDKDEETVIFIDSDEDDGKLVEGKSYLFSTVQCHCDSNELCRALKPVPQESDDVIVIDSGDENDGALLTMQSCKCQEMNTGTDDIIIVDDSDVEGETATHLHSDGILFTNDGSSIKVVQMEGPLEEAAAFEVKGDVNVVAHPSVGGIIIAPSVFYQQGASAHSAQPKRQ